MNNKKAVAAAKYCPVWGLSWPSTAAALFGRRCCSAAVVGGVFILCPPIHPKGSDLILYPAAIAAGYGSRHVLNLDMSQGAT
jgi:hypothetical protein